MPESAILLVDDDPLQLDLLEAQLAHMGHTNIVVASTGAQALLQFERLGTDIGIIISDLVMPDMDGLVLMRHLARRGFAASFILRSGATDEILNSAAGLAHAHHLHLLGVLGKPSQPERLRELLDSHPLRKAASLGAGQGASLSLLRLAQALVDGEFVPWYQPKVDTLTGKALSLIHI